MGRWANRPASALAGLMLMVCTARVSAQVPATSPSVAPPAPATPEAGATEAASPPAEPQELEPPAAPQPPGPPPLLPPARVRRYGDRGTAEVALGLGYSSLAGFLAAGGFRYFVLDGLAPGFEATYVHGGTTIASYGLALASLRVVPVRTPSFALALTARAGRMFLADHGDGWAVGGGVGILIALGSGAGLEIGYELLRLLPASFCADLSTCVLQGPVLGLRFSL